MAAEADEFAGRGGSRRACDQCRARKIRCNNESPCSNCRTVHRECSWTGAGRKPRKTTGQRVLISEQYEHKIDQLEDRLIKMDKLLRKIAGSFSCENERSLHPVKTNNSVCHVPSSIVGIEPGSVNDGTPATEEAYDQTFEGSSSMTAHTEFAGTFFKQAVTGSSLDEQLNPDVRKALESLRRMVQRQGPENFSYENRFLHRKPLPKEGFSQLALPPVDVVLKLLREVKAAPPMAFMMSCAFITVDDFIEACRQVFFATEDYNTDTFIIANAGLYHLFEDKAVTSSDMNEELLGYHYLCRDNLETALANLPLFLPPRREMVGALLFGVTYSIEISKFSLAWRLNSAAAAMCQTLGWHHLHDEESTTPDTKSSMFWFCYTIDKGLSLRFGRAPIFQDWDISTKPNFGNVKLTDPWKDVFNVWIQSSSIQSEVYQRLYSPSALSQASEQRTETARCLVDKMKQLWKQMERLSAALKQENDATMDAHVGDTTDREWRMMTLDMILKAGEVGHWASLTLIYRAIPSSPGYPSTYNTECIDAARMAFKCHEECMGVGPSNAFAKTGYLHWTILFSPFTPLIVLFCHVIETSNTDDLQRLDQFATSIEPVLLMSPAVEKLYRLCKVLYQVASLYVETKSRQQHEQQMSMAGNGFDTYLSQLGFVPQRQGTAHGPDADKDQATQLGDWFSGNSHLLGLMEEDFVDFDSETWLSTGQP